MTAGAAAETTPWPESIFRDPGDRRHPGGGGAWLRLIDRAETIDLPVHRWHGPMLPEEADLLGSIASPVLDVGCGPGRHAAALARAGVRALGIDTSSAAVHAARRRGATAIQVSVFGPVPNPGTWATLLLLDGNVGIGGDPVRLLQRLTELAAPGGRVLVEVEPPGRRSRRFRARVQHDDGLGPGFPWASVGATDIRTIADVAGLRTREVRQAGERWFAELHKSWR